MDDAPSADPEANTAVALAFLKAIADGDLAAIEGLLAPGAKWWALGRGDRERDEFIGLLSGALLPASARKMEVVGVTAEGDRVAVEAEGEFIFPHGAYRNTYHYLFQVQGGRIVYGKEYMDTAVAREFFSPKPDA